MTVDPADAAFIHALMERTLGHDAASGRDFIVASRLGPLATELGFDSVAELVIALRAGHVDVRHRVVDAMTNNETFFFRDNHPFEALRTHIIPSLFANEKRQLTVWSAAAATGQEAFSVAMLMREHFPSAPTPRIIASDVAPSVIERARTGRFSQLEVNRGLPARLLVKYFRQEGRQWYIDDTLRRAVDFRTINLVQPWPQLPAMDVILLRNVLIYFSPVARKDVIQRAIAALRPGGYLMLGSTESMMVDSTAVERVTFGRTLCFRAKTKEV